MKNLSVRLINLFAEWISILDRDGRIRVANAASQTVLGFSPEELVGRHIMELVCEGHRPALCDALIRLREGAPEISGLETTFQARDGSLKPLRWSAVMEFATGEIHFVAEDLTERREVRSQFEAQAVFLQRLIDHLPLALFVKDARQDYRYVVWNRGAERFYGYSAEEVLGRTDFEIFPARAPILREQDRDAIEKRHTVDVPEQPVDGRLGRVWVRALKVPIFDEKGGALMLGLAENINEQRAMREKLRESEARFRAIADNLPGMVFRFRKNTDGSMHFEYVSPGAQMLFEVQPEVFIKEWTDFVVTHPDDRAMMRESVRRSAQLLEPWRLEHRAVMPSGRVKWVYGSAIPVRDDEGNVIWDGVYVDITARREAEAQVELERAKTIASAKMAALGEMAAGIAHEINNPLTVISGKVHQAELRIAPDHEIREHLTKISAMVDRIARIIRALKSFARERGGETSEMRSLGQIVEDTLEFCRARFQQHGIALVVGELPEAKFACRPVEVSQVLLNLLNNAFDAVEELPAGRERRVRIEGRDLGDRVELSVCDTGAGITVDGRARLMMPFYTTKSIGKGTGLGLSISKGLIEAHQGQLFLDEASTETRFVFTLPKTSG